jgi:hypothetical protein
MLCTLLSGERRAMNNVPAKIRAEIKEKRAALG